MRSPAEDRRVSLENARWTVSDLVADWVNGFAHCLQ